MKTTPYQIAKNDLKRAAKQAKKDFPTDKPAIRMIINDTADGLSKDLRLSEHQRDLLANFACTLHPKN